MSRVKHLVLFLLILLMGIILDLAPIQVPDGIDKLYHFSGFALLTGFAISTYISFYGQNSLNYFFVFLLTFGGVFAGVAEFLQEFVLIRECSAGDWLMNLLGITIMVAIAYLNNSKNKKNTELNEGQFDFSDLPALS